MVSSLYIHIPFCVRRCIYCDFVSGVHDPVKADLYLEALKKELSRIPGEISLDTLYIGGGTPTVLSTSGLVDLVNAVHGHFERSDEYEATIEANPGTIDMEKLTTLRKSGMNRISIGVQSFQDEDLAFLGRVHASEAAEQAVLLAKEAGFENIGIDLMYGIPGQDMKGWKRSLEKAVALNPHHISAYELTVEDGTVLAGLLKKKQKGRTSRLQEEEEVIIMYTFAIDYLTANGYRHYEISNFAKPGFLCRHNSNYWKRGEYYGIGLGAHSFMDERRYHNITDLDQYIKYASEGRNPVKGSEQITREKALSESMFLGLRMTDGINLKTLSEVMRVDVVSKYRDLMHELEQDGLVVFDGSSSVLCLTAKGLILSNEVFARFL